MKWSQVHARGAMIEARNLSQCARATHDHDRAVMWNDRAWRTCSIS